MPVEFEDKQAGGSTEDLARRSEGNSFFVRLLKKAGIKSDMAASVALAVVAIAVLGVSAAIIFFYAI